MYISVLNFYLPELPVENLVNYGKKWFISKCNLFFLELFFFLNSCECGILADLQFGHFQW